MRHADSFWRAFFDEAHSCGTCGVVREPRAHDVQETAVDLVDDVQLPRQEHLEPRQGPLLERFGQQRVIRIAERARRQVPGLVPFQPRFVQQNAHQLGHRERGVRVVQLNRDLLWKRGPCVAGRPKAADRVSQRAGDQEVLLEEAQSLSFRRRVVRVEDARQRFGRERLGQRPDEIAAAELLEVEVLGSRCRPQAQRVHCFSAVSDYRPVVGSAYQGGRSVPHQAKRPRVNVKRTGETALPPLRWVSPLPTGRDAPASDRRFRAASPARLIA